MTDAQAAVGLASSTENVLTLVAACKAAGVDGFYASTQGGEAFGGEAGGPLLAIGEIPSSFGYAVG